MNKTSQLYTSVISSIINELIDNESINSYNQKVLVAEGFLSDILQHRLFPGRLVFQCLKKFRNKFYNQERFTKKMNHIQEVVYFFETLALEHYGIINHSITDALYYSSNKLMSVSTGLHLFIKENEKEVFCHDCSFENNAHYMSRFNVKTRPLIDSNIALWEEVMLFLKSTVLKEEDNNARQSY